jgi:hypothetical protein
MCDEPARVTGPDPGSSRSRAAREPSEILDGQASSGTAHGVANYAVTTIRRASRARLRRAEAFVAGGGGGLTVLQDAGGAFRTRTRHGPSGAPRRVCCLLMREVGERPEFDPRLPSGHLVLVDEGEIGAGGASTAAGS